MKPKLIAPKLKADFAKHEVHFSFGILETDLDNGDVDTIVVTSFFTGFQRKYTVFPTSGQVVEPHEVLLSKMKDNLDHACQYRYFVTKVAYGCTFEMSKIEVYFRRADGSTSAITVFPIHEVSLRLKESE